VAGYQLTQGQMNAIREVVRAERMRFRSEDSIRPRDQKQGDLCVILDAALAVATNSKTGPTSGLATVCVWSTTTSDFTEAIPRKQITVYNHSESTAHALNTFGVARWIMGHWWFFGDCAAMASRGS
jgi:hypothetical protein